MKFGKWLRRAAATAVAGCMVLSLSAPVLAETADAVEEYGVQVQEDASVTKYDIWVKVGDSTEVQLDSSGQKTIDQTTFTYDPNTAKELTVTGDGPIVIRIGESAGDVDVNCPGFIGGSLSVTGAHDVTLDDSVNGDVVIECSGDVKQAQYTDYGVTIKSARNVCLAGDYMMWVIGGSVKINCSGTVEIEAGETVMGPLVNNGLDFTQSEGRDCVYWYVDKKADATGEGTPIGSTLKLTQEELKKPGYLKIMPADNGADDTVTDAAAPAGDAGGAVAAAAIGTAAVWGGYEAATRIILNKLLPEGAAIPKTQAQLAVLLWNTAGQPEPASAPAFADVDDATAKAAQWCTEQGYLTGSFKPEKRVAKFNVIRTWNKAFPKN